MLSDFYLTLLVFGAATDEVFDIAHPVLLYSLQSLTQEMMMAWKRSQGSTPKITNDENFLIRIQNDKYRLRLQEQNQKENKYIALRTAMLIDETAIGCSTAKMISSCQSI